MRRREFLALAATVALTPATGFAAVPSVILHKDPNCGCCSSWGDALTKVGYSVRTVEELDMDQVKQRLKVPPSVQACHTAEVDGYFIEGHVPIDAVRRLLDERPPLAGLAVPGMPLGSLGMGGLPEPYDVMAIPRDGGDMYVYLSFKPG
ncbi:MAG: metal-binding protein [Kaistia sp. SCN 65-12]|nr:MAG: metal-binding protein [Kaistia sp. SCN 65-12]